VPTSDASAATSRDNGMTEDDARRFLKVFEALIALNERKATETLFVEAVRLMRLEAVVYIQSTPRRMSTAY
jgi:hypothetical protein